MYKKLLEEKEMNEKEVAERKIAQDGESEVVGGDTVSSGTKKKVSVSDLVHMMHEYANALDEHEDKLVDHEKRLSALEKNCRINHPGDISDADTLKQRTVKAAETQQVEVAEVSTPGFNGLRYIYLVHDESGKLRKKPFYSCLVAKQFDPNYKVILARFKDGQFVRLATMEEAEAYED